MTVKTMMPMPSSRRNRSARQIDASAVGEDDEPEPGLLVTLLVVGHPQNLVHGVAGPA